MICNIKSKYLPVAHQALQDLVLSASSASFCFTPLAVATRVFNCALNSLVSASRTWHLRLLLPDTLLLPMAAWPELSLPSGLCSDGLKESHCHPFQVVFSRCPPGLFCFGLFQSVRHGLALHHTPPPRKCKLHWARDFVSFISGSSTT